MQHPLQLARTAIREQRAIQKDVELGAFLALAMDVNPQIIVEIGSDAGGTLWAWQQICPRVIGVDMPQAGFDSGSHLNDHGCEVVFGDSHDPATLECLMGLLDNQLVDVLFIDGDHTYEGVKQDYEMFSPLVRAGGVIGFHDICQHPGMPFVQVNRFWASLGGEKEEFVAMPPTWGGIGVIRVPALVVAA